MEPWNPRAVPNVCVCVCVCGTVQMGLALAGVALVCLIFLGSLKVSAMVVFMVAMIDVGLLGSLHFFGIRLNAISVVNLVLCVGTCITPP